MAYPHNELVRAIERLLSASPLLTESEISARLSIHRHTIHRALTLHGTSLVRIRRRLVLDRLLAHCSAPPEPIKAVWTTMGFSSASAFSRFVRRATGYAPMELCDAVRSGQLESRIAKMGLDVAALHQR